MTTTMKPGTKVRMRAAFKAQLRATGSGAHVEEFGDCIGEVLGLTDYGTQKGPEVDVRWAPDNLKYAYGVEHLRVVSESDDCPVCHYAGNQPEDCCDACRP